VAFSAFFDDVFEDRVLKAQSRVHLLEPAVLLFELLQPPELGSLHAAIFGFPVAIGPSGVPYSRHILDELIALDFFQYLDDLHFTAASFFIFSSPFAFINAGDL
jgi:hypothetical protein